MPVLSSQKQRVYIGIDPGSKGGLAYLIGDEVEAVAMPETERDVYDFLVMAKACSPAGCYGCIEQVASSPQMGVVSAFTFGRNFGSLVMALVAAEIPFELVRPQVWQKALAIVPRKKTETEREWKERLRKQCQQVYPSLPLWQVPRSKGKQLAVADAILLARYCKRYHETVWDGDG